MANNVLTQIISAAGLDWFELLGSLWKYGRKLMRGMANEGMYEVSEYEMNLVIHDQEGKKATYLKRQKVRYLQDYIAAIQDQAWGDGEILIDYRCFPGTPVDQYRQGHKTIILISLRKIKHKGDIDEFNMQWNMRDCFLHKTEEWVTAINHRTKRLKLNVTFPKGRPPTSVSLVEANRQHSKNLELKRLPDGKWKVTWEKDNPRLYEDYIIRWEW